VFTGSLRSVLALYSAGCCAAFACWAGRAFRIQARLSPVGVLKRPASTRRFFVRPSGESIGIGASARGRMVAPNHALQLTPSGGPPLFAIPPLTSPVVVAELAAVRRSSSAAT
jgi:hypothetical protein